ncbi:UNVERIFIED_CONTAM: hypothetical protein HDU68_004355 [Siphonaria sp. JEL0065]|nr:hypothetical protein HDU68_004355 [Siphonaria sp. JEL0065]
MAPRVTAKRILIALAVAFTIYLFLPKTKANSSSFFQTESSDLYAFAQRVLLVGSNLMETSQSHVIPGSRGVVYTGSGKSVPMTIMAVELLRETGCTLSVEFGLYTPLRTLILKKGSHAAYLSEEMNQEQLDTLRAHNITPRDFLTPEIRTYNWQKEQLRLGAAKVDAILSSPFQQVLFLDPDVMPLRDPTHLFDTTAFKTTGALFWPDYKPTSSQNPIWKITRQPYEFEFEFETGQIYLDKSRLSVIQGLTIAQFFCKHAALYFQFIWGDKDAFRWGFKVSKAPYYLNRNQLVSVGVGVGLFTQRRGGVSLVPVSETLGTGLIDGFYSHVEFHGGSFSSWRGRYCGQNMLQMDFNDNWAISDDTFEPTPLFLHANGIKKFYYDEVPPFQISQFYVVPKGKTLTELGVGGYTWIGKMRGQGHCGRLSWVKGLEIGHLDFARAYPGVNERYMKARQKFMGPAVKGVKVGKDNK